MAPLALMLFIGLFGFGDQVFGWSDISQTMQVALFASFLFGIICGWRTNR